MTDNILIEIQTIQDVCYQKSDECLKDILCMQTMLGRVAKHFPLKSVDKIFFQGTGS